MVIFMFNFPDSIITELRNKKGGIELNKNTFILKNIVFFFFTGGTQSRA